MRRTARPVSRWVRRPRPRAARSRSMPRGSSPMTRPPGSGAMTASPSPRPIWAARRPRRRSRVPVSNPTLASTLAGSGMRGAALSGVQINTSGGRATYSCSTTLASGALPLGTQLNSDCTVTGTPAASGNFTFTANVTDSSLGTGPFTQATGSLTLSIAAPTVTLSPAAGRAAGRHGRHRLFAELHRRRRHAGLHLRRHRRRIADGPDAEPGRRPHRHPDCHRPVQFRRHGHRRLVGRQRRPLYQDAVPTASAWSRVGRRSALRRCPMPRSRLRR